VNLKAVGVNSGGSYNASLAFHTSFETTLAERMRIDGSGKLFVGTTAGGGFVNIRETDTNFEINTTGTSADLLAYNRTTSAYKQLNFRGSEFLFKVNDIEKVRIDTSGNVGIGTSTAYGGRLNLVPATTPTTFAGGNTLQIGEATNNTAYRLQMGYINHATAGYIGSIQSYAGGVPSSLILQGAGGNVGINTASPGAKLETFNDVGGVNALRLNTNFASGNYVDINPYISGVSNGGYSITLNGTIRQVISYTGNVGIGTSSPSQKLEVNGITYINTSSAFWEILQLNNTASGAAAFARMSSAAGGNVDIGADATTASTLVFRTAAVERARISAAGGFSVGTTTDAGSGNILASGNVTAYSDIRVKGNVEQIAGALDRVQRIRGVTYTRTDQADKERRYAGVIAQEIEEVLPEAIFDSGKLKAVDYNATIGLLIEAIKELTARVAQLEGK
jgi:hypothetical protein